MWMEACNTLNRIQSLHIIPIIHFRYTCRCWFNIQILTNFSKYQKIAEKSNNTHFIASGLRLLNWKDVKLIHFQCSCICLGFAIQSDSRVTKCTFHFQCLIFTRIKFTLPRIFPIYILILSKFSLILTEIHKRDFKRFRRKAPQWDKKWISTFHLDFGKSETQKSRRTKAWILVAIS